MHTVSWHGIGCLLQWSVGCILPDQHGCVPIPLSAFVQRSAVVLLPDKLTSSCCHLLCLTHRFANPASLNDATSWVFLNSPDNVQHVCATNVKNYNMRYLPVSKRPEVSTQPAAV